MLHPGENKLAADQHSGNGSQGVERLGKIQASLGGFRIAHRDDHRIGRGLQKGQAAGNDKQRQQKIAVFVRQRRRIEQARAQAIQQQPNDHCHFITKAFHRHRSRYRERKITEIERGLDPARREVTQDKGLLELGDQDVIEVVRHAPHEKQADDQHQGQPQADAGRRSGLMGRVGR